MTTERVVQLNQLMYRERIADETLERRLYGIEYADGEPIEVDEVLLVPDVSFREEKLVKGYKKHVYDTAAKRMRVDEIKMHKETAYGTMYTMLVCTRIEDGLKA